MKLLLLVPFFLVDLKSKQRKLAVDRLKLVCKTIHCIAGD